MAPDLFQLAALSYAYGEAVMQARRLPSRGTFEVVAKNRGVSDADFEAWARTKTWQEPPR